MARIKPTLGEQSIFRFAKTFSAAGTALTVTNDVRINGGLGINVANAIAGALSIGAHGQTLAVNDFAAGSSTNSFAQWDDSLGQMIFKSPDLTTRAGVVIRSQSGLGHAALEFERVGSMNWNIRIDGGV